jgi:hypothetical protein
MRNARVNGRVVAIIRTNFKSCSVRALLRHSPGFTVKELLLLPGSGYLTVFAMCLLKCPAVNSEPYAKRSMGPNVLAAARPTK